MMEKADRNNEELGGSLDDLQKALDEATPERLTCLGELHAAILEVDVFGKDFNEEFVDTVAWAKSLRSKVTP